MTRYEEFPWGPGLSVNEAFDASNECRHGRLPFDRTPACGCFSAWAEGVLGAKVIRLPEGQGRKRRAA